MKELTLSRKKKESTARTVDPSSQACSCSVGGGGKEEEDRGPRRQSKAGREGMRDRVHRNRCSSD